MSLIAQRSIKSVLQDTAGNAIFKLRQKMSRKCLNLGFQTDSRRSSKMSLKWLFENMFCDDVVSYFVRCFGSGYNVEQALILKTARKGSVSRKFAFSIVSSLTRPASNVRA